MVTTVIYHILVGLFSLLMLYPLFWMLSSSLKPNTEIFRTVDNLIPETFTTENYVNGWRAVWPGSVFPAETSGLSP